MEQHHGTQEGDTCNRDGCDGIMVIEEAEDCSCHINAPCHWCVFNVPVCDTCGEQVEYD